MKIILVTNEEDRAPVYHKTQPEINQFSNHVVQKVMDADYWIHNMDVPPYQRLMKSGDQKLLPEIRELIAERIQL